VNLKRARNGNGIVARLYCRDEYLPKLDCRIGGVKSITRVSTDEQKVLPTEKDSGFMTLMLSGEHINLEERENEPCDPLMIGGEYNGLITEPRAASVYDLEPGTMFLLWGACADKEIAYYELYRSKEKDFTPHDSLLIAKVQPEGFAEGRFVDSQLENNTFYYYVLRAVAKDGRKGPFSVCFGAKTRESK